MQKVTFTLGKFNAALLANLIEWVCLGLLVKEDDKPSFQFGTVKQRSQAKLAAAELKERVKDLLDMEAARMKDEESFREPYQAIFRELKEKFDNAESTPEQKKEATDEMARVNVEADEKFKERFTPEQEAFVEKGKELVTLTISQERFDVVSALFDACGVGKFSLPSQKLPQMFGDDFLMPVNEAFEKAEKVD